MLFSGKCGSIITYNKRLAKKIKKQDSDIKGEPMLMVFTVPTGLLDSNVYVYRDNDTDKAMIVDCGAPLSDVADVIANNTLDVEFIVLTHGHYDHANFVGEYVNFFKSAKVICHEAELDVLSDPYANVSALLNDPKSYEQNFSTLADNDQLAVGNTVFRVIHSPGHTPGSMCLYCEKEKILFTGDVLFNGGIGRTDFKHGSFSDMRLSLQRLLSLPDNVIFYPGHNSPSTIGMQR